MNKDELNADVVATLGKYGNQHLGVVATYNWIDDPKRMGFSLAKYKFVSKMLDGTKKVLEVGCADGFASRIVAQSVTNLFCTDLVSDVIRSAEETSFPGDSIVFFQHDMLDGPVDGSCKEAKEFDAVYSLDVLEHINKKNEDLFLANAILSLKENGTMIIGMPSLESQMYASKLSKIGHVNCKTQQDLKSQMKKYFRHVFMFSFNDEVLHTGYHSMAHYNVALCCEQYTDDD
jgi:2-polyprenyl-3-methyl-5-hydroxy-6-metoxy-1,4-benzoquinol methylase